MCKHYLSDNSLRYHQYDLGRYKGKLGKPRYTNINLESGQTSSLPGIIQNMSH